MPNTTSSMKVIVTKTVEEGKDTEVIDQAEMVDYSDNKQKHYKLDKLGTIENPTTNLINGDSDDNAGITMPANPV